MTTAIAVLVDATIVTALGLLVCAAVRRRPAALRHMILAASLAAAAAAPVLESTLPNWNLPVLSNSSQVTTSGPAFSSVVAPAESADDNQIQQAPPLSWTAAFAAMWGIGFIVVMAGLLSGLVRLASLTRRCRPVVSGPWRGRAEVLSKQQALTRAVVVVESPDRALLLTWGLWRPCIIVPTGAASWTAERIDIVLAHEIAHIVRHDWAVQIAAELLRAVYWFNPLIWMACRRLRDESEQACDDTVLRRGIDPADYASHLLAVARHLITMGRGWAPAPAVANPSTLERRVAVMLNASRSREPLTRRARAVIVSAMFAAAIPVAAVTLTEHAAAAAIEPAILHDVALPAAEPALSTQPPAPPARPARVPARAAVARATPIPPQQKPATFSGVLRDATGAVLPGVAVTLTDTASGMVSSLTSGADGAFAFRNLPPSRYQFRASLPGFSTVTQDVTLASGEELQRSMEMRVGALAETVIVVCPVGGAGSAPRAAAAVLAFDSRRATTRLFAQQGLPVRVGGSLAAPRRIKNVQPVCPVIPPPASGVVVVLESTIGADGLVKDIKVLRPTPGDSQQAAFVQSAMDAVRQWEFTPTRLNNVPIPVIATVTVTYGRQ